MCCNGSISVSKTVRSGFKSLRSCHKGENELEIWRRLIYQGVDYGDFYHISTTGLIRNAKTLRIRKNCIGDRGYYTVCVSVGCRGSQLTIKVHRAVAETFIPNYFDLPIVNHRDGNKLNNNFWNLEWCTSSYNSIHAFAMGLRVPTRRSFESIVEDLYYDFYDDYESCFDFG